MPHVREQVVDAVVERLRAIPALEGRVWAHGSVGWDLRSHPVAFVVGLKSRISEASDYGYGLERRDVEVLVEVYDLETAGADYVARIGDICVSVEAVLQGVGDDIPVEDVRCLGDTGVTDVDDRDERGVKAGCGVTFSIGFYTHRGDAGRFATPDDN